MKKLLLLILILIFSSTSIYSQNLQAYTKVNDTIFMSNSLSYAKPISIYLPKEWQEDINNTFPLTIVFDRQNKNINGHIINTIDYLTATTQIPSSIIISIDSKRNKRYLETSHKENNDKGLINQNIDFLFKELIPYAERELKANTFRLFIGHSRYAFFSANLFVNHINDVTAVIALDPFFIDGNIHIGKIKQFSQYGY
ncbi:alpha/beta hydrolase-fold protein [uncultured Lacinutrix sp.]|uniref:alpha/beta hydrolase-fold protein n=1 Tax=uncultured Lacinutrix sp. TaxID=574032 RepID=UPI00261BDA2C|nr:alpha/beta hydrolase-fold protein [uncultured Lacinutrix sp.]